jgi:hypothetical protein
MTSGSQSAELNTEELILIDGLKMYLCYLITDGKLESIPFDQMLRYLTRAQRQSTAGNLKTARDHLKEGVSRLWYNSNRLIDDGMAAEPLWLSTTELAIINGLRKMMNFLDKQVDPEKFSEPKEARCYLDVAERLSDVNVSEAREYLRNGIRKLLPILNELIVPMEDTP